MVALTTLETTASTAGFGTAATALLRAAFGLIVLGLAGFGTKATIDRQSGKVRRR